jgi:hypothetical protein
MFGDGVVEAQFPHNAPLADLKIRQSAVALRVPVPAAEYEVENHFQFQLYSNPFSISDNDQSHT